MTIFTKIKTILTSKWLFETIYLFVSLTVIYVLLYDKYTAEPVVIPPVVQMVQENLDNKRLENLEEEHLKLVNQVKQLQTKNEELSTINQQYKQLEKKNQVTQEYMKRICEYILVITVDKKIIPRHCLPEHNWNNE